MKIPLRDAEGPRVLLVEDDPVSRAFLAAAVRATPATVDEAAGMQAALALAGASSDYDLWLFDARLPDGSGAELLARLRACHPRVPALAHTAATDAASHAALSAAGFDDLLVKPLPATAVAVAIRNALGMTAVDLAGHEAGPWDDAAAVRALNGNHAHVEALRGLFRAELPVIHQRIRAAAAQEDIDAMGAELHRLLASCGFVGAARLARAARDLQSDPRSPGARERFEQAVDETLAATGIPAAEVL